MAIKYSRCFIFCRWTQDWTKTWQPKWPSPTTSSSCRLQKLNLSRTPARWTVAHGFRVFTPRGLMLARTIFFNFQNEYAFFKYIFQNDSVVVLSRCWCGAAHSRADRPWAVGYLCLVPGTSGPLSQSIGHQNRTGGSSQLCTYQERSKTFGQEQDYLF